MYENSNGSTSLPTSGRVLLFNRSHSSGYVSGISVISNDVEQLFRCLFAIHISYLVKCLFKSAAYFKNWIVVLLLSSKCSLYILEHTSFVGYMFCK